MATYNGNSILQICSSQNPTSGYHTFTCNGVSYATQVLVLDGNQTLASNPSWGDSTNDATMLVVIVKGNLTINAGVTVTPLARKRGFTLFVRGDLTNNGTISMTARGASATGQNVYLWKNSNGTYETVPAVGANMTGLTVQGPGGQDGSGASGAPNGNNGTGRGTGSGGAGQQAACWSGTGPWDNRGGPGSSYSGGPGGGGWSHVGGNGTDSQNTAFNGGSVIGTAGRGRENGGAGGTGYGCNSGNYAQSGAGNPAGALFDAYVESGPNGTGGLLIILSKSFNNNGTISSNGVSTPSKTFSSSYSCGGASGGGSVNIFYSVLVKLGTLTATGGTGGTGLPTGGNVNSGRGGKAGNGGNGTTTHTKISMSKYLIFFEKLYNIIDGTKKYLKGA